MGVPVIASIADVCRQLWDACTGRHNCTCWHARCTRAKLCACLLTWCSLSLLYGRGKHWATLALHCLLRWPGLALFVHCAGEAQAFVFSVVAAVEVAADSWLWCWLLYSW